MRITRPWLLLPPKLAHDISPWALNAIGALTPQKNIEYSSFTWKNTHFSHRAGVAGGVDKNARNILAWERLGAAFIEVGTITPKPQKANPGTTILRNLNTLSLWNSMGFPNEGVDIIAQRLKRIQEKRKVPLFANIGKNRDTPLEDATKDYLLSVRKLTSLVDAFVINISSPNTENLRQLSKREYLEPLLKSLKKESSKPLFVKLSPDHSEADFYQILKVLSEQEADGIVLTNTTTHRDNNLGYLPKHGGISGKPLSHLSLNWLKITKKFFNKTKKPLLISSGGILNSDDLINRIEEGADLVQVYSALVFEGPFFFRKVYKKVLNKKERKS